jgi:hypothetical protein
MIEGLSVRVYGFRMLEARAENRKVVKDRRWMAARQGDRVVLQFRFESLDFRV